MDKEDNGGAQQTKRLLMVDDRPLSLMGFRGLVRELHGDAWAVEVFENARDLLNSLDRDFPKLPSVVSIDLGLPPEPQSSKYGLQVLSQINEHYPGLKLVVHSAIMPIPDRAAQYILSLPASYISIANDADIRAYAAMLPWISHGFRLYSPSVSDVLGRVVLRHPDPLDDAEWTLLALLFEGKSNLKIAEALHFSETRVAEKIAEIAKRLKQLGHVQVEINDRPTPHRYREPLSRFYAENAVRYQRSRQS